jgi:SAM-dependent methyltransferase
VAARYDGIAEWFDREFATSEGGLTARAIALDLLGPGTGRLLDVGCGSGAHTAAFADAGWHVTGVDVSDDQLRLARQRGVEVVQAAAESLPFPDSGFDAAISLWTHTDVDDFPVALGEIGRVVRPGGRFVYLGAHPCFVGPHSQFRAAEGVPVLHPGYRRAGRYTDAPGVTEDGLRARVGASHLPLGAFVQAFLDAGFRLERFVEPETREYPYMVGLRCRR